MSSQKPSESLTEVEVPSDELRFQMELEFIQCLASPAYLHFLAINRYFENPAFLNFLQYMKYWKNPHYAKYIVYPHGLAFLDMLDDPRFRQALMHEEFSNAIHAQQFFHWQFYLNNRYKNTVVNSSSTGASTFQQQQ